MKQIYYCVAMSLDGFIAGPDDQYDWITIDPDIDFDAYSGRFDTILMGRKTFQITGDGAGTDTKTVIVSTTLESKDCPGAILIKDNLETAISELRSEPGKDIWLFGGGTLFASLLDLSLVDVIEVAIIPILLGDGIPLLQPLQDTVDLSFLRSRIYEKTGTVSLEYKINKEAVK